MEAELDPAEYEDFADHWRGTPEAAAALKRAAALRDWARVDQCDAAAIEAYRRPGDFPALAAAIDAALAAAHEATRLAWEARREERRRFNAVLTALGAGADGGFQERLKSGGLAPEMVALRGGAFRMGSPDGIGDVDEWPQHDVAVPSFAIGRFPVTFNAYDAYCASAGADRPSDHGWGRGDRPVINVSWDDAVAYCAWLSKETGALYRLPSEAEWEFACRAGTKGAYAFGDDITPQQANYGRNVDGGRTTPVAAYPANGWGLHDMHGNVWEWVQDCWHGSYENAPEDGSAWMDANAGDCTRAVLRGGSWDGHPGNLRSAFRLRYPRDGRYFSLIGFRVTRTLATP